MPIVNGSKNYALAAVICVLLEIDDLKQVYLSQNFNFTKGISAKLQTVYKNAFEGQSDIIDLKFLSLELSDTFSLWENHNAADVLKWLINALHDDFLK